MSNEYKPEWAFIGREKPVLISKENEPYFTSYLMEVKKRSDPAYKNQKCALTQFFEYVYTNLNNKNVVEITKKDVRNYLNDILDKKEIKNSSKNSYRSYLSSFFDYIEEIIDSDTFTNPVPNKKKYKFTQYEKDVKKQSEKELEILTKTQLLKILDYCHKNRRLEDFILFGLCICTGARISEIITIKLENINLQERYFETGFEKNARKSTLGPKKSLLFFFPGKFKIFLKNYILSLKSLNPDIEWLFPGKNKKIHATVNNKPYYILEMLNKKLGFHFSYRYFRKSIITERVKMNCPDWISEGLTNHIGTTVQKRHYITLTIKEKRDYYDVYFPYVSFPYF